MLLQIPTHFKQHELFFFATDFKKYYDSLQQLRVSQVYAKFSNIACIYILNQALQLKKSA